jgi:hypothetical protein
MTNQQYSITPPPELVRHWARFQSYTPEALWFCIANEAAQWGADQELEACCLWLNGGSKIDYDTAALLRAARRPKPLSLKEQALAELAEWENVMDIASDSPIRRALEQLPE